MLEEDQERRLEALRAELSQGDVVTVHAMATLGAPEATMIESTREADQVAEFRVTSIERVLPSGLWAIVTQTCDIARDLDLEPFIHLTPLVEAAGAADYDDLLHGRGSVRRYAYPRIFDTVEYPVLDVRVIQTVEKTALVAEGVDPLHMRFDPKERFRLSAWLGRRFARHAFPDDLEDDVLRPLRESARKRLGKNSAAGGLLGAREAIMVGYADSGAVEILFVLNQARLVANERLGGDERQRSQRVAAALDEIMRPVARHVADARSTYTLTWRAALPANIPYADVLYRLHPLDLE